MSTEENMREGVALRDYLERVSQHERELREAQISAMNHALSVAKEANDYRLDEMNKVRDQITSERNVYVRRDVIDSMLAQLELRVRTCEGRLWMFCGGLIAIQLGIAITMGLLKK